MLNSGVSQNAEIVVFRRDIFENHRQSNSIFDSTYDYLLYDETGFNISTF
jgi:hypothetical protein